LLWLACQPNFPASTAIKILHVGPPVQWAQGVQDAHIMAATTSSGTRLPATIQATKNLTEVCGLLRDSILSSTAQRVVTKDSKGFKKLPAQTQTMFFCASEPPMAGYANAQGKLLSTGPVTEYGEVLAATSSSQRTVRDRPLYPRRI
jgi:hypothetical protein